jgi:nicotinamidase-related amidase
VPDSRGASVALLLIDVINEFAFPEAPALLRHARPMARALRRLKGRARAAGIPVVYVNDNFGRWRSDFAAVVRRCVAPDAPGRDIARMLAPEPDDYFVLKPKHSGFYATGLAVVLDYLGAHRLILTGLTTPQCVLLTAADAHMRDFELIVPADCAAADDPAWHRQALAFMKRFFDADTRSSRHLVLRQTARENRVRWARGRSGRRAGPPLEQKLG